MNGQAGSPTSSSVRTTIGATLTWSSAVGLRLPALIRYEQDRIVSSTVIGYATA